MPDNLEYDDEYEVVNQFQNKQRVVLVTDPQQAMWLVTGVIFRVAGVIQYFITNGFEEIVCDEFLLAPFDDAASIKN